jgi:hypothetical protein
MDLVGFCQTVIHDFVLPVDLTDHRVFVSAQPEDQRVQKEGGI